MRVRLCDCAKWEGSGTAFDPLPFPAGRGGGDGTTEVESELKREFYRCIYRLVYRHRTNAVKVTVPIAGMLAVSWKQQAKYCGNSWVVSPWLLKLCRVLGPMRDSDFRSATQREILTV